MAKRNANQFCKSMLGWICVVLAVCCSVTLVACSGGNQDESSTSAKTGLAATADAVGKIVGKEKQKDSAKESEADSAQGSEAESAQKTEAESSAAESAGESGGYGTWAKECTDKWNTPTVYAIMELKGWQLETMLQEMGYTWNKEDSCWFDGNTTVAVYDQDFKPLDDQQISKLDKGGTGSPVIYVINTHNYPHCKSAYTGLASGVMVSEDSEFTDDFSVGFGVVYGPSMKECLVELVNDEAGVSAIIFNKDALKAGIFDKAAGGTYGTTPEEVFKSLTGRAPASQQ